MMINMENFIFALGYTLIAASVAFYYWKEGRELGIRDTVEVIGFFEPEALMRIKPKLQEIINASTNVEQ